MLLARVLPVVLALAATPVAAANLLFEDFSAYGPETLNATSASFNDNWSVSDGTVDLLTATGTYGSQLCNAGTNCVDLDGTTNDGGVFSSRQVFGPGRYTVTFQLAGNQRIDTPDEITISFGPVSVTFSIGRNDVVASDTASIFGNGMGGLLFDNVLVGAGGTVLSFANAGGDNQGAILKTATVDTSPVPLPAGGVLLLGALGGLGWFARRRAA